MFFRHLRRLCYLILVCAPSVATYALDDEAQDRWNWSVIGPFENYSGSAFTKKLEAELPFDTLAHRNGRGGRIAWHPGFSSNSTIIDLSDANAERSGAYLANTYVESRDRQAVTLYATIAGSMDVYVNDSLAFTSKRDIFTHTSVPICRVTLEKGWNRFLIKAGNNELPFCYFMIFMMDASGRVIQEFASTPEPRLYPQSTASPEPLDVPDSLFDLGYKWDDAITDSLMREFDIKGFTTNGIMQQAVQYKEQGLFSAALEKLQSALERTTERYDVWFLKAYTHLANQQKDSAIVCLERGLALDPGAYGPFTLLRKLKNEPDIFTYFGPINTDSIIQAAFAKEPRQDMQMEIILHDERIAVIAGGSSVVEVDQIFRIRSDAERELFSRYQPINGKNVISLSMVDYKYYRDSVVASPDGDLLVLDNIEPGDLIRIRQRYIERDTLQIPMFYRHRHELQRRLYAHRSRFQIITPKSDRFQWRTYNTMAEPEYEETPLGYRLLWNAESLEPLANEVDMPRADLTGLIEVGTVPSWEYVAQRYNDAFVRNVGAIQTIRDLMDDIAPEKDSLRRQDIISNVREFIGNINITKWLTEGMSYPRCRSIESIMKLGPKSATDYVTMFISMLAARNIVAYPMMIDTNTTPFHAPPTPSATFNHMIVVVPGDSLPSFFDPTARPFASYYSLPYNVRGAFGLVIRKGLREPLYVANDRVMTRYTDDFTSIKPNLDGSAMTYQTTHSTEQDSSETRAYIREAEAHSAAMQQLQDSIWCEPVAGTRLLKFCRRSNQADVYMRLPTDTTQLVVSPPWRTGIMYPKVPYDTIQRKYPLLRWSVLDSSASTFVVHAPPGYTFAKNQPRGIFNVESVKYTLLSLQQGDSLIVTRKVVFTQPYVTPEAFMSFQVSHAKMVELDEQPIVLVPRPRATPKRKKK